MSIHSDRSLWTRALSFKDMQLEKYLEQNKILSYKRFMVFNQKGILRWQNYFVWNKYLLYQSSSLWHYLQNI